MPFNIFNKIKINKKEKGFTLIESIVAITVLVVGVLSVFSFLTFNISQSTNIKNKIIALNLAQEGIEIIRNIRDNCWISNTIWASCLNSGVYNVNYNSATLSDLPDGLEFNGINYFHSNNPNTPFQRIITITDNPDPDNDATTQDIKIESKVIWQGKIIILEERFYNWF